MSDKLEVQKNVTLSDVDEFCEVLKKIESDKDVTQISIGGVIDRGQEHPVTNLSISWKDKTEKI
ncbi:MAG: hypothetical protein ABIC19_00670 [Patescibacteria group bacterium]|nr:hypothetical protein [Patescibacteria group bacterium]